MPALARAARPKDPNGKDSPAGGEDYGAMGGDGGIGDGGVGFGGIDF